MRRKAKQILRGEQGLSMILVLCIGAVFVALSAALVYAASVLTANANRQLLEQEVYQLATGFSDTLGEQLNDPNSQFAKFINESYMKSEFYGNTPFELESTVSTFDAKLAEDGSDGADAITIALRRRPGEGVENLNVSGIGQSVATSDSGWRDQLNAWQANTYKLVDLQLDMTVTVKKDGESFAYTVTYDRSTHYEVAYYTLEGHGTAEYKWNGDATFTPTRSESAADVVTVTDTSSPITIVPHFDTSNPQDITYTRGVRQKSSTTQE